MTLLQWKDRDVGLRVIAIIAFVNEGLIGELFLARLAELALDNAPVQPTGN